MASANIQPLLEEKILLICENLYNKSIPIKADTIMNGLKEKRFPVSVQTPRVIQYYLDNTDISSVLAARIKEKDEKEKKKTKASVELKSPVAKKTKLNHSGIGSDARGTNTGTNYLCQTRPTIRLAHLAGIDSIINKITELIFNPIYMSSIYEYINIQPTCTILFHGPTGCGKTSIANAIAGELNVPYFRVSAPELIGSMSGESEQRIKMLFSQATSSGTPLLPNKNNHESDGMELEEIDSNISNASGGLKCMPTIVFIDNIDVIAGKSEGNSSKGMDKRVMATLAQCIDDVINCSKNTPPDGQDRSDGGFDKTTEVGQINMDNIDNGDAEVNSLHEPVLKDQEIKQKTNKLVIFIACTNKAESLDPTIRGRFANEIAIPVPDAKARSKILQYMCRGVNYDSFESCQSATDQENKSETDRMESEFDSSLTPEAMTCISFQYLGSKTAGYVGADLKVLVEQAGRHAVQRIVREQGGDANVLSSIYNRPIQSVFDMDSEMLHSKSSDSNLLNKENCKLKMHDFIAAMKSITPTAKREGFAIVPEISFKNVGALSGIQKKLGENIIYPIKYPELYADYGLGDDTPGIMMFGPPGCGKTLLAKAVANECGANFISVKGPELLKSLVGESEACVRQVFERARASTPCVIFFDEIDSLVPKRGGEVGGNGVADRVVAQFLTELDGVEGRKGVYVMGATNRLDMIDDAILRSKRFGTMLYVPLPTAHERVEILKALTFKSNQHVVYADDVSFQEIGEDARCDGLTGADLSNLLREASLSAIREFRTMCLNRNTTKSNDLSKGAGIESTKHRISRKHFEMAFENVKPSVPYDERMRFDDVRYLIEDKKYGAKDALEEAKKGPVERESE